MAKQEKMKKSFTHNHNINQNNMVSIYFIFYHLLYMNNLIDLLLQQITALKLESNLINWPTSALGNNNNLCVAIF